MTKPTIHGHGEPLATGRHAASPRQISLGALMTVMLIFTVMSAGVFYASRIQVVQDELKLLFGISPFGKGESSRKSHLMFLLFTYASPLLMAAVLSTAVGFRYRKNR